MTTGYPRRCGPSALNPTPFLTARQASAVNVFTG
jgi:hypothetical protein